MLDWMTPAAISGNCTPEQIARRNNRKPVNLALQGGGAHGAFTWGVLDKLLEADSLSLDAVSATSAGALNAIVMAEGFSQGGTECAREKLNELWEAVSRSGWLYDPIHPMPWDVWSAVTRWRSDAAPGFLLFQMLTHTWSPYQLNPMGFNPLRDILEGMIDFERLRGCPFATRLFISATNVRSGKVRIFENHELSADVVLASACLPYLFKAVEIDGEHYWDGGFMGNPAIFPLIYKGASRDVIVVHVNSITRANVPTTAPAIFDRMNEITFNSSLMREMRAIAFVSRLIDGEILDDHHYARMRIHAIRDDAEMMQHGAASKFATNWAFLTRLRNAGRDAAERWLYEHSADVGDRTTIDLQSVYL